MRESLSGAMQRNARERPRFCNSPVPLPVPVGGADAPPSSVMIVSRTVSPTQQN